MAAALAAGTALPAWAQPEGGASGIYSCTDARGRRITSDRPIIECLDREQRVLGSMGATRGQIGPSLTEHERAALEERQRKEAEQQERVLEQRRRDRALLARYPNQAAHDAERAQALAQLDEVTVVARQRVADLQQISAKLQEEMEFYKSNPKAAPAHLRRRVADNQAALAERQRFIAQQASEAQRLNQRFDAELAQLHKLWAQRAATAPLLSPPGASATAR